MLKNILLFLVVVMMTSEAKSVAWIPNKGDKIKREGILYNSYPKSYLNLELPGKEEETYNIKIDLGGFKTLGFFLEEYSIRKDLSLYSDMRLRYEFHKLIIESGGEKTGTSISDTSIDMEIGAKKQLLNAVNEKTNDVITVFLGLAPGSIYTSEGDSLFSRNNAYFITGISYGKSFFKDLNKFIEISVLGKRYFYEKFNEIIFNMEFGVKPSKSYEFSIGALATSGEPSYKSNGLEMVYNKMNDEFGKESKGEEKEILEKGLKGIFLPKKARKKMSLYFNNYYKISKNKTANISFLTEVPLSRKVWSVKLEFNIYG